MQFLDFAEFSWKLLISTNTYELLQFSMKIYENLRQKRAEAFFCRKLWFSTNM